MLAMRTHSIRYSFTLYVTGAALGCDLPGYGEKGGPKLKLCAARAYVSVKGVFSPNPPLGMLLAADVS